MAKAPNWTKKEDENILRWLDRGVSQKEIAVRLNRTEAAVFIRKTRLGYKPNCQVCGVRLTRNVARKYCVPCSKEVIKAAGDKWYKENGWWKVERYERYKFSGLREKTIKRDKEKCVECGMTRDQHRLKFGCDITVDHKDGKGSNSKKKNNTLSNLQTLCLHCHGKKDAKRRRKDWSMCIGERDKKGTFLPKSRLAAIPDPE